VLTAAVITFATGLINLLRSDKIIKDIKGAAASGDSILHQSNEPTLRVLITRTVSSSEISIVKDDIRWVKSFYQGETHRHLLKMSKSNCGLLRNGARLNPYGNDGDGSQYFPNQILCNSEYHRDGNNFFSVHADFMLFALNSEIARQLNEVTTQDHTSFSGTASVEPRTALRLHRDVKVDVIDVSAAPKKLWNWIIHANEETLDRYDYVWFVDGDIRLTSLNWHAFFMNIRIMRPKISQPASISVMGSGSVFKTLTYQQDTRVIAAEVPIVEVQAPILEVETWLRYSKFIQSEPSLMTSILLGGENCFDMGWCHLAKNNMQGKQLHGIMWDRDISFRKDQSFLLDGTNSTVGRSCIVFYQTPIIHNSKQTRQVSGTVMRENSALCDFLREKKGVIDKEGPHKVNELFNYQM